MVSTGNVLCRIGGLRWIISRSGFGLRFHRDSPQLYASALFILVRTLPLINTDRKIKTFETQRKGGSGGKERSGYRRGKPYRELTRMNADRKTQNLTTD